MATPEGFDRQPELVHRFYDARRAALANVEPNAAHHALAELERAWATTCWWSPRTSTTCTSGPARRGCCTCTASCSRRCAGLRSAYPWAADLIDLPPCPGCGVRELRPDVVWFGEIPYQMERIQDALAEADLFVSVGTSGAVYPAAGFVQYAAACGARTLELNLVPSAGTSMFDEARHGPAGALVPAWVAEL